MLASLTPLLGVMKFEREPIPFQDIWGFINVFLRWVQDAGGFAMFGLVLWIVNSLINPIYDVLPNGKKRNRLIGPWMLIAMGVGLTIYLIALGLMIIGSNMTDVELAAARKGRMMSPLEWTFEITLAVAGFVALLGFAGPFFVDLFSMSYRRIYAIAKLSFKEAVRRKIVWVFLGVLVLYLFPARWFFEEKPEDELKSIIGGTTRGMNVLLVSVGLLLAGFSIPNDIKNLTIHTIITKPVQRFEIVLGRFLGYLGLISAALIAMTAAGLLLINLGNVSEEAQVESMKARQALYGNLEFRAKASDFTGVDVGREEIYRKYIAGQSSHRAVWLYESIPSKFGSMPHVPLEFAFDIYRTTKGEEGAGVSVSFEILTHKWSRAQEDAFNLESEKLRNVRPSDPDWPKVDALAEKYGRYIVSNWQIFDYHTSAVPVPAGLFRNALDGTPSPDGQIQTQGRNLRRVQVTVRCDTPSQFVGAAKHDLYFLQSEGSFSFNYFKGALGLWFRIVIAIALSVACSTYLAGVLSFLTALFLFVGGFFLDFIQELARGVNIGGGPLEAAARLLKNSTATTELDPSPAVKTLQFFDDIYKWLLRRMMNVIPDVDKFGLSDYVAQGFDIGLGFILWNVLCIAAYVLPWLVAAYYLMKAREIAA